ncbi:hypothetical protein [Mucilaginibacter paludis]|uniref:Uncharacterized protein n=1 Tax=Mucilaginibacter paludis DSM 18603 TaxID=714943 RepID=H1YBG5_9SPHI|nr:hypothetical protein [Mucilaginibacter paludis]EHQ25036.1 hypothetical protein Mucpa_0855 [Mucilaginibacter paludis DSM 18603]
MKFKNLTFGVLVIWIAYYVFLGYSLVITVSQLKMVTVSNYTMRTGGAFGVIKHYYIEPYVTTAASEKNLPVDRTYAGFSLAGIMLPKQAINRSRVITFYALDEREKVIHFAASEGTHGASQVRLYIDLLAYLIGKYVYLHVGLLLLWAFSGTLYARLNNGLDVAAEIASADRSTNLEKVQLGLFFFSLIILLI